MIGNRWSRARSSRRSRGCVGVFVGAAVLLTGLLVGPAAAAEPRTWVVDADRAQCGNADFTSIQAAVDAAAPGDVVRICPDVYAESVLVDKPLTLWGDPDAVEELRCWSPAAAQLSDVDPTRLAVIDPAGDGFSVGVRLLADDVVVTGLVVQGATVGVDASDRFSGYRIHHDLVRLNALFGVDFGSAGVQESRVDHSCIRENRYGLVSELDDDSLWKASDGPERDAWNARDLRNARIDHNVTVRNSAGIEAAGPGTRQLVTIDHNELVGDRDGVLLLNATGSSVVANDLRPLRFGIVVGGDVVGPRITDNRVVVGLQGIVFVPPSFFIDPFVEPTRAALVTGNTASGLSLDGILAAADRLYNSQLVGNLTSGNGRDGIVLRSTIQAAGNVVGMNSAEANARYGIYSQGAQGNLFQANVMLGNGLLDARDEARATNTWVGNRCLTDFPTGSICELG